MAPTQQAVVDKYGQPIIGADSKPILVPTGSTFVVPHADGRCHIKHNISTHRTSQCFQISVVFPGTLSEAV